MTVVDGLRVVVTGSTRGLGLAFARDLAERGARVVLNGVDEDRCRRTVAELRDAGLDVVGHPGSVADEDVADGLVATAVERFGGIDAVVNNAGVTRDRTLKRMSAEEFDTVIAVHLRGTWLTTRAAVRAMGPEGLTVVNVVSGSALYGLMGQSNYAAAKGGMLGLTRALHAELGSRGVRLNCVSPMAATDMTSGVAEHESMARHFGAPADVAPLVSYLVSPGSAHLACQVLGFDGRELTIWSHPAPVTQDAREEPWSLDAIAGALGDPDRLQTVNPDGMGLATWDAFGVPRPR